ncbi:hypothetical protein P8452_15929 [Trifolium repens]|nr:hypothetical protein P8452_15929 [Trifolium repens]
MRQVVAASFPKRNMVVPEGSSLLYETPDKSSAIAGSRKLEHSDELRLVFPYFEFTVAMFSALVTLVKNNSVALFLLLGIILAGVALGYRIVRRFVISKEDGSVDARVAQFVKWAMRVIGTTFILQSTIDTPLAIGVLNRFMGELKFERDELRDMVKQLMESLNFQPKSYTRDQVHEDS